ncbi:NB-ARC domain-containing protein, partial [Amycolatopsis sp. NPDC059021]|uniref:NB-ARC domain-containing protein n=1 Tax=Amycolatopsis sp. NPDC059021 TaxID=3346704 RepID=UPI003672E5ED
GTPDPIGSAGQRRAPVVTLSSTPAQLPHDIDDFAGRVEQVEAATRQLVHRERGDSALRGLSVSGMPGVGKTAFAIHLAQRVRAQFPDGQFFTNLRPAGGAPRDPADVLRHFLRSAGFTDDQLPADLERLATHFRTWTSSRRALVVLDDAVSPAQVQSLLPAGPECAAVITSRSGMPGLAGVRTVELDPLTDTEGLQMLVAVLGADRVAAEQLHALPLVELCGHLPLAIRCVAARLQAANHWPLRNMLLHLVRSKRRLDLLSFSGIDVRRRFASSYEMLEADAQLMFRSLAKLKSGLFSAREAAELFGCEPEVAEMLLVRLVGEGLLRIFQPPGDTEVGFRLHPLLRLYAKELWPNVTVATIHTFAERPAAADLA